MGIARDRTPWLLATVCLAAACCAFLWGTRPVEAGEHEVSVWLGKNKEEALLSAPLAVPGTASLGKATAGTAHSVFKTTSAVLLTADKGARHAPGQAAEVRVEDLSEIDNTDKSLGVGFAGQVHRDEDAGSKNVNEPLVQKFNERERREEEGVEKELDRGKDAMAAEIRDRASASRDRRRAAELRLAAKAALHKELSEKTSLSNAEEPIIKTDEEIKEANQAYDDDALELASLLGKISSRNSKGEPMPAKLSAHVKKVEAKMKAEKRVRHDLDDSISSEADTVTAADPGSLDIQSKVFTDSTTASKLAAQARSLDRSVQEARDEVREDNMAAKRSMRVARCVAGLARKYHFDQERVDNRAAYTAGIAKCAD